MTRSFAVSSFAASLLLAACVRATPDPVVDPKPVDGEPQPGIGRGALAGGALSKLLMPPAEAGTLKFAVEGCAAKPNEESVATRALPPPDSVQTSVLQGGVLLTHEVAHACCLSAASAVTVEGTKVVVTETLSGTPCRCRCSSSLRTAVGLKPGTWSVEVKTVEPGRTWSAWTGELTVEK